MAEARRKGRLGLATTEWCADPAAQFSFATRVNTEQIQAESSGESAPTLHTGEPFSLRLGFLVDNDTGILVSKLQVYGISVKAISQVKSDIRQAIVIAAQHSFASQDAIDSAAETLGGSEGSERALMPGMTFPMSPASPAPGCAVASSARREGFRRPPGPGRSSR
jgi:hypothetical protein